MTLRVWRFFWIVAAFTLATWMASCGMRPAYAQPPAAARLDKETTEQLQQQYDDLTRQLWATNDPILVTRLNRQLGEIGLVLTERDLGTLRVNDAQFGQVKDQLNQTAGEMSVWAHRKWCHRTVWRRLLRYREPAWCSR